jgi:hypothetical protein
MNLKVDKNDISGLDAITTISNFCCDSLKKAFNDKLIGFGDINNSLFEGSDSVNIYKYNEDEDQDEDDDKDGYDLYPINFCPFCGATINIEEV